MTLLKFGKAWVAGFIALGAVSHSSSAQVGTPIAFQSEATGKPEMIKGHLSFPKALTKPVPLMLIMHSSGGVHARDWFFARTLNDMGVATLVLDSFGPRNLKKVHEDKRSFGEREQAIDALTVLEMLKSDRRVDATRIGAMGRSLGGQTAVRLTIQASRDQLPKRGPNLSLALSITPGCTSQQQDRRMTSGSQARLFLAEKDGSPYQRCVTYVEKMKASGGDADFKLFKGAFHTFDGSLKPVWHANDEVYAGCENDRISPSHAIRLDTGAALRTRKDWDEFFKSCVKRGMWTGGSPEATRELDRDWIDAVKRRWLM